MVKMYIIPPPMSQTNEIYDVTCLTQTNGDHAICTVLLKNLN